MADFFLQLPPDERREALGVAAASSGRPIHLLAKDVWVVWVLEVLFQSPFATHLVFKGGSSLSKAYQIIRRFSEDVDLTYDIRVLAPVLVGVDAEPLPLNSRGCRSPGWLRRHSRLLWRLPRDPVRSPSPCRGWSGNGLWLSTPAKRATAGRFEPYPRATYSYDHSAAESHSVSTYRMNAAGEKGNHTP